MVRIELTADDSFAAIRARSRVGMAIAAMIRMIATPIRNSISENPFCFRISFVPLRQNKSVVFSTRLLLCSRTSAAKRSSYVERLPSQLDFLYFQMGGHR